MASKSIQNRSWGIKNRSWDVLAGVLGEVWWPKPKTEERTSLLGPSWRALGAVLGSSWPPKGSQERPKSNPKSDQNFVACWDRFLDRFWSVLGSKAGPSWLQNRYKIDVNIKKRFFKKLRFSVGKTMIRKNTDFGGSGSPT